MKIELKKHKDQKIKASVDLLLAGEKNLIFLILFLLLIRTITLKVPSLFVHDWIKTNYLNTIIQVVQHISTTTGQYKLKLVI